MKLILLFYVVSGDIICDKGVKCPDRVCQADICEYHWVLEERHSMAWRTVDARDGRLKEYGLVPTHENGSVRFKVKDGGYHVNGPVSVNGTEKDPNDDLQNIIPLDGREYRRVITINDDFPGPVIRAKKGAIIKGRREVKFRY